MPPRNTARPRQSDKPRITGLNLDKLAREGAPAEPYRTVLNGQVFTFSDPFEQPWQDQVRLDTNNAVEMLRSMLDDDQWQQFRSIPLEAWKLVALVRDIQRYYAVDAEAEGNGAASPAF